MTTFAQTTTFKHQDEEIQAEFTRLLYRQSPVMLVVSLGIALLLAWVLWSHVAQTPVMIWLGLIFLLNAPRGVLVWGYRTHPSALSSPLNWCRLFAFSSTLSGFLWGSVGMLFFTPEQPVVVMLILLVLMGTAIGALLPLSTYRPAFYGFTIPAILPAAVSCWSYGGAEYRVMGILLLLFLGAILAYSHVIHAFIKKNVQLQFDNLELVQQLREEKKQIEAADRAKTRFLAAASHDLRQPIHALGLFTSGLEKLAEMPELRREPLQQLAQKFRSSISGLSGLLGALLDISKLDAGIVEAHPQSLAMQPLLESLQRDLGETARIKKLRLTVMKTSLAVISDPVLLQQILGNLVGNALRYTKQGGIVIGCRRRDKAVEIQVWDSGIGIPEVEINAIFDEFHQLHNAERDREQGLGLGLAIVRRSAQLLGHEVKVRSVIGKGSMFSISVPRALSVTPLATSTETKQSSAPTIMPSPEKFSMLVIDDDKDVLTATADLIRAWGYSVVAMPSAATALAALDQQPEFQARLGLMLVDSQLANGLRGVDAVTSITQHLGRAIPAAILTGDTSPQGMRNALASGLRVLHKPLDADIIKLLIAEAGSQ